MRTAFGTFGSSLFHTVLYGSIAIVISWLLSSCRFGNNEESTSPPETWDGYYEMKAYALDLTVNLISGAHQTEAATSLIPAETQVLFSNPVIFTFDAGQNSWFIYNPFLGTLSFYVPFNEVTGVIPEAGLVYGSEFFGSQTCQLRETLLIEDAKVTRTSGGFLAGVETKGRIRMDYTHVREFDGDCAATLQSAADCYDNELNCPDPESHDFIVALLGLYVDEGLMSSNDFSDLLWVAHKVSYH